MMTSGRRCASRSNCTAATTSDGRLRELMERVHLDPALLGRRRISSAAARSNGSGSPRDRHASRFRRPRRADVGARHVPARGASRVCSPSCSATWTWPTCSSRTTSPPCARSPIACWSCIADASSKRDPSTRCSTARRGLHAGAHLGDPDSRPRAPRQDPPRHSRGRGAGGLGVGRDGRGSRHATCGRRTLRRVSRRRRRRHDRHDGRGRRGDVPRPGHVPRHPGGTPLHGVFRRSAERRRLPDPHDHRRRRGRPAPSGRRRRPPATAAPGRTTAST